MWQGLYTPQAMAARRQRLYVTYPCILLALLIVAGLSWRFAPVLLGSEFGALLLTLVWLGETATFFIVIFCAQNDQQLLEWGGPIKTDAAGFTLPKVRYITPRGEIHYDAESILGSRGAKKHFADLDRLVAEGKIGPFKPTLEIGGVEQ